MNADKKSDGEHLKIVSTIKSDRNRTVTPAPSETAPALGWTVDYPNRSTLYRGSIASPCKIASAVNIPTIGPSV
jgi:hypothetical protein